MMQANNSVKRTRAKFAFNPRRGQSNPNEKLISMAVQEQNKQLNDAKQNSMFKYVDLSIIAKLAAVSGLERYFYNRPFDIKQLAENALNLIVSDNFIALKLYNMLAAFEASGLDVHKISRALSYILFDVIANMVMRDNVKIQEIAIKWIVAEYAVDTFLLE